MTKPDWLNRTVVGAGLTSFLADVGYEMACSLIPSFLLIIGLPSDKAAAVLGAIEAVAEFVSNGAKLIVGWYSDKIGKRKFFVVGGYALTGSAFSLIAIGWSWPFVMLAKSLAWLGKGIRGPLRNAIISDSVDPAHRGKAFGFHRAGDTCGAVLGPLIAAACIAWLPDNFGNKADAYFTAFWLTVIPGLAAAFVFWFMIKEIRFTPKPGLRLGASLASMPSTFKKFLVGVGLFGIGDFAHTLLILVAANQIKVVNTGHTWGHDAAGNFRIKGGIDTVYQDGFTIAILLFAWRNLIQAIAAFPAGWLGDRIGHRRVLVIGYVIGACTMIGIGCQIGVYGNGPNVPDAVYWWLFFFALAGVYMAIQETVEPAIVPELVPDKQVQGTAFGVLAAVNGYGDVVASFTVGLTVYYFGWPIALGYAALMMTLGAIWMASLRSPLPLGERGRGEGR